MQTLKIKSIKKLTNGNVVNLHVDKNQTFVTGNHIVVHNCQSVMPALRGVIEEFSRNVVFIFTANYKNRIIPALLSRLAVYEFEFTKEERQDLLIQFDKRIKHILADNNIVFDKKVLAQLLIKYFPDFRKILNELQRNCQTGELNSSLVSGNEAVDELIKYLKDKNFTEMRKWVGSNSDIDYQVMQRNLYDRAYELLAPSSIPQLILHLSEYDYRNAFVIDKEINIAACLLNIMSDCEFK